jgi:hypothetical protein
MYDMNTILQWFWMTQDRNGFPQVMMYYIPMILIGIIAAIFIIAKYHGDYKKMGLFAIMWLAPISIVLAQSEFIVYHYLVMLFPAIISVVLLKYISIKKQSKFILGSIASVLVLYLVINSMFGSFTVYEYSFWQSKEMDATTINLTNQSTLLFLDPGDAPYYFHANSSCHYITPMPVERNAPDWDISYLPQYKETRDCIINYQGEYIISNLHNKKQFFGTSILSDTDITVMMDRNYTKVISTMSWDIYHKNK